MNRVNSFNQINQVPLKQALRKCSSSEHILKLGSQKQYSQSLQKCQVQTKDSIYVRQDSKLNKCQKQFYHLNISPSYIDIQDSNPQRYNIDLLQQNGINNLRDLEKQLLLYDSFIPQDPPSAIQTQGRVIVVGDIHGDLRKFIQSLLLAELIDISDGVVRWTGGDTTVVQLGDILDRGNCEIGILLLIRALDVQARMQGGGVYMLNGNHEVMNARSLFRSVTQQGFEECCKLLDFQVNQNCSHDEVVEDLWATRASLYAKGGIIAKQLGRNPTTLKVNDILFAHGGVLPEHCQFGLDNLNFEVGQWFNGQSVRNDSSVQRLQAALQGGQSIVWNRSYSVPCATAHEGIQANENLDHILKSSDCRCLVVGHTPQKDGANSAFNGKVWRMDVGMSEGIYDLHPQLLEITWDQKGANFNLLDWKNYLQSLQPLSLDSGLLSNNKKQLQQLIKQGSQFSPLNLFLDNVAKQLVNI